MQFSVISSDDQRGFDSADEVLEYLADRSANGETLVSDGLSLTPGADHADLQADVIRSAPDRAVVVQRYFLKGAVACDGLLISWMMGAIEE